MRLEVNGTILNIFEAGNRHQNRPTLVFLHYFGGSSDSWKEITEFLAADFHCVAPDLRGFGASDNSAENYTVENYADDVQTLITALKLENFVLIGHSMGGKFALALAARSPHGLRSLILLAPSPPTPEPIAENDRKHLLESHGSREAAAETVRKAAALKLPPTIFKRAVNDNLRSSENAWRAWLERESRTDISAKVQLITVPVLVLSGENDETIKRDLLKREVVNHVAKASFISIPKAGHLLPLEVPEITAQLIADFIDGDLQSQLKSK